MSKLLFTTKKNDTKYYVYLAAENEVRSFAVDKDGNLYFVNGEEEIKFLNGVIKGLNKKYLKRDLVIYNNERFMRFVNQFNKMSYFIRVFDNGSYQRCNKNDYPGLYEKYNGTTISFLDDKKTIKEDINGKTGKITQKEIRRAYGEYKRENRRGRPLQSIFYILIAGVLVAVELSAAGCSFAKDNKIPDVTPTKDPSEVSMTHDPKENDLPVETQPVHSLKIFEDLGYDIDITPDTEEEIELYNRFSRIENQLREAGFLNWEIAYLLDSFECDEKIKEAVMNDQMPEDPSDLKTDISFYYDSNTDSIIYIYGGIPERTADTDSGEIVISENIQMVIDAINQNENLSEEQRQYIINTYLPVWVKNERYINPYELVKRYGKLEINYDYHEGGKAEDAIPGYMPAHRTAGEYIHRGLLSTGPDDNYGMYTTSIINVYDSEEFDPNGSSTLNHELNHINGNFAYFEPSLVNEGYTQLSGVDCNLNVYRKEQLLCILLIETFGSETLKAGYYGFDLEGAIVNEVVANSGKSREEVDTNIYQLLNRIQDLLYKIHDMTPEQISQDPELLRQYSEIVSDLSVYYSNRTGKDFEDNQIVKAAGDLLLGTHRASFYDRDNETITGIYEYNTDNGEVTFSLSRRESVNMENSVSNTPIKRTITLNGSNKHDTNFKIKDSDIDYFSR